MKVTYKWNYKLPGIEPTCVLAEIEIFKVVHYRLFIRGKHMKYDECHRWRAVT